ncbi:MAG: nucleoside hydrolase [Acholeplasmataceae bacterium]
MTSNKKHRVFIDTDIGDDIDDIWALTIALSNPSIDVIGISVNTGDTTYKATLVAKILYLINYNAIPIFIGKKTKSLGNFHESWLKDFNLNAYQGLVSNNFNQFKSFLTNEKNFKFLALGPMYNLEKLHNDFDFDLNLLSIISMSGSIYKGYINQNNPGPEYNIIENIDAYKLVITKCIDFIMCPLDVSRNIVIDGKLYQKILHSKTVYSKIIIENYIIWDKYYKGGALKFNPNKSSTILFDLVVIMYLLFERNYTKEVIDLDILKDGSISLNGSNQVSCLINVQSQTKMIKEITKFLL